MILLQGASDWSFAEKVFHADYWLLLKINREWQNPLFDRIALVMRESITHAPLYLFMFFFVALNFGKKGIWWAITLLTLVGITDLVSSKLIKEWFDRPRPCRDEWIAPSVRLLASYCGMNGSFVSSHASNHFSIAIFSFMTLGATSKLWALLFFWAGLICYAQMYVGVHYPSDILGGIVVGLSAGWLAARFFNRKIGPLNLTA